MALALSSGSKTFVNTTFLLLLCFFFTSHIRSPSPSFNVAATLRAAPSRGDGGGCAGLQRLEDHRSKCAYLKTHARAPCVSQGYVDYLRVFYCDCGSHPLLGYALLALWILVLFYLLATTASQYFCSSVESLSRELRLPPTVAGVTLLSLGNGSPDVLASVVSFRSGSGEVGLSSVLGGAFFVSCVVVGIISVCAADDDGAQAPARVDRSCFVRDVCFFVVVLSSLLAILLVGRINVWGAAAFASLYFVYVFVVSATHLCRGKSDQLLVPILEDRVREDRLDEPAAPALQVASKDGRLADSAESTTAADTAVRVSAPALSALKLLDTATACIGWLAYAIDMPLYLPRRLTIPDVSQERWRRPFAVASAALAPLLVAALWNSKRGGPATRDGPALTTYACAGLAGLVLGIVALRTTEKSGPPKKALLPWLAGGFLMSVLWTYVIAEELVGLLVSLGYILGISPAILGLTVLAWGTPSATSSPTWPWQ
uniref:Sodium/calcium exchanger membrane region domain-containing protein n=1 Tax=Ananas comosus var. bracteatus TaxID=296719 RepID=A0A6V7QY85_ANACO